MRKKGIKYYLSIFALCCSICYLLLRIFGIMDQHFHFKSLTAYAEDVVLTPQQTAALLGSSFPVTYHNSHTNIELNMTATLIGTTNDFDLYYHGGGTWAMPFYYANEGHHNAISPYNYAPGLVYAVPFANIDDFVTSNSAAFFNFRNDFSISLNGITRFEMPIFWGATRNGNWGNRSVYNVNTSNGLLSGEGLHSRSSGYPYYQAYVFKSEDVNQDDNAAVEDRIYLNCFPIDLQSETEFTVSGITCGYNACNTYDLTDMPDPRVASFYIIVECPVISNFTPATTPAATSAVTTTRSPYTGDYQVTTAQYTYDLSPLETNQINQINIANENLNYVAGIFDGINIIIQQLDDIYNRMVANGEIAVDLLPADPVKWYETDVKQQIDYIIDGHTTATLPDISNQMSFIGSAYNFLMSETWIAMLGGLSLAVSVACWVLFEGRK